MYLQVIPTSLPGIGSVLLAVGPAVIALIGVVATGILGGQWTSRLRSTIKDDLAILTALRACNLPTTDVETRIRREVVALYVDPLPAPGPRPIRVLLPYVFVAAPFIGAAVYATIEGYPWGITSTVTTVLYAIGDGLLLYGTLRYNRAYGQRSRWLMSALIKAARELPPDYPTPTF
jgi:hypothetical protein